MKFNWLNTILIILAMCVWAGAWTYTYDTATPPDTGESPSQGADRIREVKEAIQEFMNDKDGVDDKGDHYWPLAGSAVGGDDADVGMHRKIEFQAVLDTPTIAADQGCLYMQDVDGGDGAKAELYWHGEDDIQLQLTELNTAGDGAALNLTGTYENEVSFENTGNEFYTDSLLCTDDGVLNLPDDTTDTTEANLRYNTTDDVAEIRDSDSWDAVLTDVMSYSKLKIGTYTGDAEATKAITGVGFQPELVFVIPGHNSNDTHCKTTDMPTTYAKAMGRAPSNWVDDSIRSLDADGFTVGDGENNYDDMNVSGITYYYIAARVMD